MKKIVLLAAALAALAACGPPRSHVPSELGGRWEVQQIAGASLGEGVDVWIEIDPATGAMHGFTGCNAFTATMSSFGDALSVGAVSETAAECPSAAAATDEARFLGVLPSVQRHILHGRALELLSTTPGAEALLRLRLADAP